jgi:hypothetical protein
MLNGLITKGLLTFIFAGSASIGLPAITVTSGDSQVQISWPAATFSENAIYLEESTDAGVTWKTIQSLPPDASHAFVGGLTNAQNYWFRIQYLLPDGTTSTPSNTVVALPTGAPAAPTTLSATSSTDQVSLTWDKPALGSTIIGYEVDQSSDGGATWSVVSSNTHSPSNSYLISGLTSGTTYTFQIKAIAFGAIASDFSTPASVLVGTLVDTEYPLSSTITPKGVDLVWGNPTITATLDTYRVELSTDGGMTWVLATQVDGAIQKTTVPYVLGGALYRVIATAINGQTAMSQVTLAQITDDPNAPVEPGTTPTFPTSTTGSSSTPHYVGTLSANFGAVTTSVNGGIGSRSTLPPFDIKIKPKAVAQTQVAALALLALLTGATGIAARRREDEQSSLENIDYENLERIDGMEERGDLSRSWRWPSEAIARKSDEFVYRRALSVNSSSPLLARLVLDGSYLRAMLGAPALITWLFGLALGGLSLLQTHAQALPPLTWVSLGLICLGILDAAASLVAVTVIFATTLVLGGYGSIPALRTTLGLAVLWFGPSLIASAARPLRRPRPVTFDPEKWRWERAGDFVVGPLLAAWAVRSMIHGLPALAGLNLPIVNNANLFAGVTALVVLVRYALEEVATRLYPARLRMVEDDELPETTKDQKYFALFMKVLLFIVLALPFMGSCWQLYAGALMFAVPAIARFFVAKFPNSTRLYQILPVGIPKFALMLVIGAIYSSWVGHLYVGNSSTKMGFVLMSIPGLAISTLALFGRSPQVNDVRWYMRDQFTWLYRLGAIVVIAIAIFLALR